MTACPLRDWIEECRRPGAHHVWKVNRDELTERDVCEPHQRVACTFEDRVGQPPPLPRPTEHQAQPGA